MFRNANLYACMMALILLVGCIPQVKITSPKEGTKIILGDSITFQGIARSGESVLLAETDALDWYVDDVLVHIGSSYTTDTLRLGEHIIAISGYIDVEGSLPEVFRDTVTITVIAPGP